MNYYKRHLGDYAKDAGHLTMLEHGAYNLLIDRYYSVERPIQIDEAMKVCRARSSAEREAVESVLREFFFRVRFRLQAQPLRRGNSSLQRESEQEP